MNQKRKRSAPLRLDEVERLRQARGLTVEELASKVRIDLRNMKRWLSGKQKPLLHNLNRLAAAPARPTEDRRANSTRN